MSAPHPHAPPLEHPVHLPKKCTIVKDRVGCVRTSTYNLPPTGHTYGRKNIDNAEGCGEIMSNWVTANPSNEKKSSKMVVYSNVLAVKHGCITARAMRQYSIDHPNIRLKEVLTTDTGRVDANHEGPFGIKTKFAEESMENILGAKYTNFHNEDADYPVIQSIQKTGHMPTPRPTVASQAIIAAREKANEKAQPKHFIMKRFQNIKGKMARDRDDEAASKKGSPTRPEPESENRRED